MFGMVCGEVQWERFRLEMECFGVIYDSLKFHRMKKRQEGLEEINNFESEYITISS